MLPLLWETVPEEPFDELWKSMPNTVATVLELKRG